MLVSPRPGSDPSDVHRVVVLGAGYAGAMAVNRTVASLTPAEADHVKGVPRHCPSADMRRGRCSPGCGGSRRRPPRSGTWCSA